MAEKKSYWTDPELITKDPKKPIYVKKKHTEELVFSNPAMEVDSTKKDIVHRIMEYTGDRVDGEWWVYDHYKACWKIFAQYAHRGLGNPNLWKLIKWDSEKEEIVSRIKEPPKGTDKQGKFLTPKNSTKVRGEFIETIRRFIEDYSGIYTQQYPFLHKFTGQSLKELITGKEREGYDCPRCDPTIGVLSSELYCSYCGTDWEQKNGKWFPATWTDPMIHYPLVFQLQQDYPKGTIKISFSDYAGRDFYCSTVTHWTVPVTESLDFKKRRYADYSNLPEGVPDWQHLWQGLPAGSFIVFDNHFAQYAIQNPTKFWSKQFYEGEEDEKWYPYKVNFSFQLNPPLKFDVKKGSWIQIFPWRLARPAKKDEDKIVIDSANYFWMDFEEVCKRKGEFYISVAQSSAEKSRAKGSYIDAYFYPGASLNFRQGKTYIIKEAKITSDNNIEIKLDKKLTTDIEKGRGLYLFTRIEAKHIEELRNALDNLKWEGQFPRHIVGCYFSSFRVLWAPGWCKGGITIVADSSLPFVSEAILYPDGTYLVTCKIRMSINTKGFPRYVFQLDKWLGNRRPIGQGQVVDNKIVVYTRPDFGDGGELSVGWTKTAKASGTNKPFDDLGLEGMPNIVGVSQGFVILANLGQGWPPAKNCSLRAAGWQPGGEYSCQLFRVSTPFWTGGFPYLIKDDFHEEGE